MYRFFDIEDRFDGRDRTEVSAGLVISHINAPRYRFYDFSNSARYRKLTLHGSMAYPVGGAYFILATQYMKEGPHYLAGVIGGIKWKLRESGKIIPSSSSGFFIGGGSRVGESLIISAGFELTYLNIFLTYEYGDISKKGGRGFSSLEFTLSYQRKKIATWEHLTREKIL